MMRTYSAVAVAMTALQCLTCPGMEAAPAAKFDGPWQAEEVFGKSTEASVRQEAYAWTKEKTLAAAPRDFADLIPRLSRMAAKLPCEEDFETVCLECMGRDNAESVSAAAVQLADSHARRGNPEKAVDVLRKTLASPRGFTPAQTASMSVKAAGILSGSLERHAEAVDVLESAIGSVSTNDPVAFASLANAQSTILLARLSNPQGAERRCRQVLELGASCPGSAYAAAAESLASILRANGDAPGAAAALCRMLQHPSLPNPGVARKLLDAGAKEEDIDEAIRLFRLRMTAPCSDMTDFRSRVERIQPELVELLQARGLLEEAGGECRVFMFCAADNTYPKAVELAAKALKMLDGNLGRANALLDFQGAEAADAASRRNVLMDIPRLQDAVRQDARGALARSIAPSDWNGWLLRSARLLWLDCPAEAMDAASQAFASCPLADSSLQVCAEALVRPLLVATRDAVAAQTALDYLLHGPMGKDGQQATEDDLEDPLPALRKRLAGAPVLNSVTPQ